MRGIAKCEVIPVLKADGYGIGAEKIINILSKLPLPQTKYFVYALEEGIILRKKFKNIEIYILRGIFENELEYFMSYNLIPVVNSIEQLQLANSIKSDIILQFNTGMNRSGINLSEVETIKNYVKQNNINVLMLMSHLCCADEKTNKTNLLQITNFENVIKHFPDVPFKSITATAGLINNFNSFNSCRAGIGVLFGYYEGLKNVVKIWNNENEITMQELEKMTNMIIYEFLPRLLTKNDKALTRQIYNNQTFIKKQQGIDKAILQKTNNAIIHENDTIDKALTRQNESLPQLFTENDKALTRQKKIKAIYKNNTIQEFYSTLLEKRICEEDGIVGYGATKQVKKGDCLGIVAGGYLDGIYREIGNYNCSVYIKVFNEKEKENFRFIECPIYGRISMDQTIIKIPSNEFKHIKIGAEVVIFNNQFPAEKFVKATGIDKEELFYYVRRSRRVLIVDI